MDYRADSIDPCRSGNNSNTMDGPASKGNVELTSLAEEPRFWNLLLVESIQTSVSAFVSRPLLMHVHVFLLCHANPVLLVGRVSSAGRRSDSPNTLAKVFFGVYAVKRDLNVLRSRRVIEGLHSSLQCHVLEAIPPRLGSLQVSAIND